MGVYTRKRKTIGPVHYIDFVDQFGVQRHERSGGDKTKAKQLLAQRRREVLDGTYSPEFKSGSVTLSGYAASWGRKRKTKTARDDRSRLRDHVLPHLGHLPIADVAADARHIKRLVEALEAKGTIGPKTIQNVLGTLSSMFRDAKFDGIATANPCTDLPRGIVPVAPRKSKPIYELEDVAELLTSPDVPLDRRVFYALAILSGMRHGEAAGRRWRHYDTNSRPLGALTIDTQYYDQPLKSPDGEARPRRAPVHPVLAAVLEAWRAHGFAAYFGRQPRPDDFIVPSRMGPDRCRTVRRSLSNLVDRDCPAAGVEAKTFHRFRDTFLSLCRRSGARKDVIEMVTHNAKGDVVDQYTDFDWAPLCEAVLCLPLEIPSFPLVHAGAYDVSYDAAEQNDEASLNRLASERGGRDSKTALVRGTRRIQRESGETFSVRVRPVSPQKSRPPQAHDARHSDPAEARRARLEALAVADPEAAAPGLALCRGLSAALRGDEAGAVAAVNDAAEALGHAAGVAHG